MELKITLSRKDFEDMLKSTIRDQMKLNAKAFDYKVVQTGDQQSGDYNVVSVTIDCEPVKEPVMVRSSQWDDH